jgi:hypothetical protein
MGKKGTPSGVLFFAPGMAWRRALLCAEECPRIRVGTFGCPPYFVISPLRRLPFLLAQKKGSKNCALVRARGSGPKSP